MPDPAQEIRLQMAVDMVHGNSNFNMREFLGFNIIKEFEDAQLGIQKNWEHVAGVTSAMIKINAAGLKIYDDQLSTIQSMLSLHTALGQSTKMEYENASALRQELFRMANNHKFISELTAEQKQVFTDMVVKAKQLVEPVVTLKDLFVKIKEFSTTVGLENWVDPFVKLATISGVIGGVITLIREMLKDQSKFIHQNYAFYGSMQEVASSVRQVQIESGVLKDQAMAAMTALMQASVARDQIKTLGIAVADLHAETDIGVESLARYVKRSTQMGINAEQLQKQFKGVKQVMSAFGLTGKEATMIIDHMASKSFALTARLGKSGFDQYSADMMKVTGAAKSLGLDLDELSGIMKELETNATEFAAVLGADALYNDPAKNLEKLIAKSDETMAFLNRLPQGVRDEVARSYAHMSYGMVKQLQEFKSQYGAAISGIDPTEVQKKFKIFQEDARRTKDPLFQLQQTVDAFKSTLIEILQYINPLLQKFAQFLHWISELPGPVKTAIFAVTGLVLSLGAISGIIALIKGPIGWITTLIGIMSSAFTGVAVSAPVAGTAVATSGIGFAGFFKALSFTNIGKIFAIIGALAALAGALWLMNKAVDGLDWKTLAIAMTIMVATAAALTALGYAAGNPIVIAGIAAVALGMVALAGALWIASKAVQNFTTSFSGFTKTLYELAQLDLLGIGGRLLIFGTAFAASAIAILAGMGALLAASMIGAAMLVPAAVARVALSFMAGGLEVIFGVLSGLDSGGMQTTSIGVRDILSNLSDGAWAVVNSPWIRFIVASRSLASGLSSILGAIAAYDGVLERLPIVSKALNEIMHIGAGPVGRYAAEVEVAASRIGRALNSISKQAGTLRSIGLDQATVRAASVVTVRTDYDERINRDSAARQQQESLNDIKVAIHKLTDVTSKISGGGGEEIARLLKTYLPQIAFNSDSGLASSVNKWIQ